MSILHNIYSRKKLKLSILKKNEHRITLSFYKYFNIRNPYIFRDMIYTSFVKLNIFGRVYIAKEGINAQINILHNKISCLKKFLNKINKKFKNIHINSGLNTKQSFWMLQVKVRKQIVSDGLLNKNFDHHDTGIYVQIKNVNQMLYDPNVVFIDMRNDYEFVIGHFEHAVHVPGSTFRDQLKGIVGFLKKYKEKTLVLYCTGGIRCEKATSWLKYHNFKNVYHIQGGILNYVNESQKNNFPIKFKGKNFVFDHRMSERVSKHILGKCKTCQIDCDDYINCRRDTCHDLFIQCTVCQIKYNKYCSINCKKFDTKHPVYSIVK
ncbi:rhodanese-related sulfurtransferase [Buchnera aphidicola]|uniref:tRNA uridine(34) hydroxylase n=1 Tax=Buchnera aphidicola (Sarucallis kahawaluokalani) TaxID=1241878 RepID=A0A4D6Y7Y4_9GAMM|nr:rhodanese-related sulfurtransferase [Buchnera aphidicola]QCI26036.1 rhodanese-related sulfurtransferase [Buchnera aphidicola (Sarucallis kahawaluokalani)]